MMHWAVSSLICLAPQDSACWRMLRGTELSRILWTSTMFRGCGGRGGCGSCGDTRATEDTMSVGELVMVW